MTKYVRKQLGGLFNNASFANSDYVPQFVGSNFDTLKNLGDTLDQRYRENKARTSSVVQALAQDRVLAGDDPVKQALQDEIEGKVANIASSEQNFENSTGAVQDVVDRYVTSPERLKLVQNFEKGEEVRKLQAILGKSNLNFGDNPDTFTSIDPETQQLRDFNQGVEKRENYAEEFQNLIGRVASDGYYTDPKGDSVQITPDVRADILKWQRGEMVSSKKIESLVTALIPSYLASVAGNQDLRRLQKLEPATDYRGNPVTPEEDIKRRFLAIAAPQIFEKNDQSVSAVNIDKPLKVTGGGTDGISGTTFRPGAANVNSYVPSGTYNKGDGNSSFFPNEAQKAYKLRTMDTILAKHGYKINSETEDVEARYSKDGKSAFVFQMDTPEGKELNTMFNNMQRYGDDFGFIQYATDNPGITRKLEKYIDPNLELHLFNSDGSISADNYMALSRDKKDKIEQTFSDYSTPLVTNLSAFSNPTLVIDNKEIRGDIEEGIGLGSRARDQANWGILKDLRWYDPENPTTPILFEDIVGDSEAKTKDQIENLLLIKKNMSFNGIVVPADGRKSYGYSVSIGGREYFAEETTSEAQGATQKIKALGIAAADPAYTNPTQANQLIPGVNAVDLSDFNIQGVAPVVAYSTTYDNAVLAEDIENDGVNFVTLDDGSVNMKNRTSGVIVTMEMLQQMQANSTIYPSAIPIYNGNQPSGSFMIPYNEYLKTWEMLNNRHRVKQKFDNE